MGHMTTQQAENADLFSIGLAHKDVPVVAVLIARIENIERENIRDDDYCDCCEDDYKSRFYELKQKCEDLVKSRWVKDGTKKTKKLLSEIAGLIGCSAVLPK